MADRRPAAAIALVALVLVLAGCATPATEPESSTPPSPPPTSAAPEPVVAAPGSRVPLGCDELAVGLPIADMLGGEPTLAERHDIVLATAGIGECRWEVPAGQGENALIADISADPASIEAARAWVDNGYGCRDTFDPAGYCSYGMITASYLVTGWWQTGAVGDATAGRELVGRFLDGLAATLDATTPLPAWTPPVRGTAVDLDCSALGVGGTVAAAIGDPAAVPNFDGSGDWSVAFGDAIDRIGWMECSWIGPPGPEMWTGFILSAIPGGAWGWDDADLTGMTPVAVAGADAAVSRCDQGQCFIEAIARDSYLRVYEGVGGGGDLARAVAGLEAAIPLLPLVPTGT